jgi:hypothetical protein
MSHLQETIDFISKESLSHLGSNRASHAAVQAHLDGLSRATEEARNAELVNLKRLHIIGLIAAALGLALIGLSCYFLLVNRVSAAAVPAVPGLLSEIVPVVVFRQIESTRKNLRRLLPDHERVLRAMLLLECMKVSPDIAKLITKNMGDSG